MGKHRDLKRDLLWQVINSAAGYRPMAVKQLTFVQLDWDGDASGTSKLGRHQRHRLTVYRLGNKRHVAGLPSSQLGCSWFAIAEMALQVLHHWWSDGGR
jgi:hypothetical protein